MRRPHVGRTGLRRCLLSAVLCLIATAASAGEHRRCRHHCRIPLLLDPRFDGLPSIPIEPREYGIPPETVPDYEPQGVPFPSPQPGNAPYPQGFVLDVPITPGRADTAGAAPGPLTRYREVADALAHCWRPPAEFDGARWSQATLRVSFKRNGAINGVPLIPFVGGDLTPDARSGLKASLLSALRACAPLPFSPGLGAAVAGQIFALRFINQDQN